MNLTETARDAIIEVMKKKNLDPQEWYLEFRIVDNGAIGLGFTKKALRQILEFGELRLTIDGVIDTEGVVVDYGENDGRKGLFFIADAMSSSEPVPDRPGVSTESVSGCGDSNCTCEGDCDDTQCGGPSCACAASARSS